MSTHLCLSALMLLCVVGGASAQDARREDLLQGMPKDYRIGFQTRQGTTDLIEMVPMTETVETWSRMITTMIVRDARPPAGEFQRQLGQRFSGACGHAESIELKSGQEGGYPFTLWQHVCHRNPATGAPEYTWVKTLEGRDAFYNVQFAFRHAPNEAEANQAMHYLAAVRLTESSAPHLPKPPR